MTNLASPLIRTPRPLSDRPIAKMFFDSARSEWVKLRSIRSALWLAIILVGVSALGALNITANNPSAGSLGDISLAQQAKLLGYLGFMGMFLGQFLIAALAGTAMGNEYSHGMIRTTLVGAPRRMVALAAKLVVTAIASFSLGVAAGGAALAVGYPIFHSQGLTVDLFTSGALLPMLWQGVYFAAIAVLAVSTSTIFRSTAATLTLVIGALFVPLVMFMSQVEWAMNAIPFMFSTIGQRLAGLHLLPIDPLSSGGQLGMMLVWLLVPAVTGAVVLARRDA